MKMTRVHTLVHTLETSDDCNQYSREEPQRKTSFPLYLFQHFDIAIITKIRPVIDSLLTVIESDSTVLSIEDGTWCLETYYIAYANIVYVTKPYMSTG